jgi:DNA helicase-2/ATP-dependent DNA helicase PcrA
MISQEEINNMLIEKTKKKEEINDYMKRIFELENEIIKIDNTFAQFSDNIILSNLKLSQKQEEIVMATEDYILVVACPGSGKTHTLISRYIKLTLDCIYKPEEILLITFTKKAGMEMMNRLNSIIPSKLPQYVGSLHGLAYKTLQEYMNISYTVLDEKDTGLYLKDLFYESSVIKHFENMEENDINMIKSKVQIIFDMASVIYPFNIKTVLIKNNLEKYSKDFNYIYRIYTQKKKRENILDFNDLMIMFCKFLDSDNSTKFLDSIKYVFFDEYQDVNMIQNYILKKFTNKSKIMVVGDDAQSIYSFRGSSVSYILNFDKEIINEQYNITKTKKMYLLEENYRSTPYIVNFCQNIISNNMNQFSKSVVSKQDKNGIKPTIYSFKTVEEQYKWIVSDILSNMNNNIKLSQMVILARKNNLLNDIELHLLEAKIPVAKNTGLSLLDKSHIKDFMSFIIILTNNKSSLHWKRVISLFPGYNIKRANNVLESDSDFMKAISIHINKEKDSSLNSLYEIMIRIKKIKNDMEKAKLILTKLQELWTIKKEPNVDNMVMEVFSLLNYLKDSSINEFINSMYLNKEIETNNDNLLYLTTIHGAKGLEWDYVYLIDMDASNFPSIRPKYYLDEFNDVDEERRLFYVASSRAKKYHNITFCQELKPSPFIREINKENYNSCGLSIDSKQFICNMTNGISKDITNYLKYYGYNMITPMLLPLTNIRNNINKMLDIPSNIDNLGHKYIIGTFIDYLISKILQINYPKKIKNFDLPLIHKHKSFPQTIYLEYIDIKTDWRNILEHIFYIATFQNNNMENNEIQLYHDFLVSESSYAYYIELEKGICKLINNLKPKEIYTHYNCSLGSVLGEIDILCIDSNNINTIIEIKCGYMNEIANTSYISQVLLYAYLLKRKEINTNNMILYNPLNGETNTFDISTIDLSKFKNTIYK